MSARFILASNSPRRKQLLTDAGFSFIIEVPGCDERIDCDAPDEYVTKLAKRKALAVATKHPGSVVLAADTVVWLNGPINKPKDEADALNILSTLSGREHVVYTGVCACKDDEILTRYEASTVCFRSLSDEEIRAYIATGEPMDKAGAYGAQGIGGGFIETIDGHLDNVMGLPVALARTMLEHFGVLSVGNYGRIDNGIV